MTGDDATHDFIGKRVLVVEDEAMIALQLQYDLEDMGFKVIGPAPSARKALQLIERETIDAAVLDFRLGEETSGPVAAALIDRNVPFTFMTGHSVSDLPGNLRRYMCLQKPVLHQVLIAALATIMKEVRPA